MFWYMHRKHKLFSHSFLCLCFSRNLYDYFICILIPYFRQYLCLMIGTQFDFCLFTWEAQHSYKGTVVSGINFWSKHVCGENVCEKMKLRVTFSLNTNTPGKKKYLGKRSPQPVNVSCFWFSSCQGIVFFFSWSVLNILKGGNTLKNLEIHGITEYGKYLWGH